MHIKSILQVLTITFFIASTALAQEICNNCIDDDDDGLIDCYDEECIGTETCGSFFIKDSLADLISNCLDIDSIINDSSLNINSKWIAESTLDAHIRSHLAADIDNDGISEIVTIIQDISRNFIVRLDGKSGNVEFARQLPESNTQSSDFCYADIDNDGFGEIIVLMGSYSLGLVCFEHDLSIKWNISSAVIDNISSAIGFADFDADGIPEIYLEDKIFNALTGDLIAIGGGSQASIGDYYSFSFAADILDDDFCPSCNGLELICGNQVYAYDPLAQILSIAASVNNPSLKDGYSAVGDVNGDDILDVVVNEGHRVYAWNPQTGDQIGVVHNLLGAGLSLEAQKGSVPALADIDNDGKTEIVIADHRFIYTLDDDLTTIWQSPISDMTGGPSPTPALFDFNCDGILDIVQRSGDTLRIIDSKNGLLQASSPCRSGTLAERVTIADVDADGHADIIIGCGSKISAFSSATWAPARNISNQFMYNITNINDDLTVPCLPQNNATASLNLYNSFLTQSPISDRLGQTVCYDDTLTIGNKPNPDIKVIEDASICMGSSIELNAEGVNGSLGPWISLDNDTIPINSTVFPSTSNKYFINLSYTDSCQQGQIQQISDSINILIIECIEPYIPNVFTPNDDGDNDVFKLLNVSEENFHLQIFNRLGKKVFETKKSEEYWTGKNGNTDHPTGVYSYVVMYEYYNEEVIRDQKIGNITLLK